MQVEDLSSPVPEIREAAVGDKADLLQKITNGLLMEDRLVSIMCIRKGKVGIKLLNGNFNVLSTL